MRKRLSHLLAALGIAVAGTGTADLVAPNPAADACYTGNRTVREGTSGNDVAELQVRLAGWVASGENLAIDGVFGPPTARALKRFQSGYGLAADGVADNGVYTRIYALQDADCTPIHFSYAETDDNCRANNFSGGKLDATTAKRNTQLEAMRRKLGDRPMVVSISFRSGSCNASVGGASNSRHMYGHATDFSTRSGPTLCQMYHAAKTSGFEEILGPGYLGHNDHTHVANDSTRTWSAPNY